MPQLLQIQNFVQRQRAKFGRTHLNLNDLNEYISMNSSPVTDDQPGVLFSNVKQENQFVVIWSTKKLYQKQLASDFLQVYNSIYVTKNDKILRSTQHIP